ncbi:unnamed protein product [Linum tenue]|uniref:Uncharacterized protein n=1 Tax=Linum tenue TaxID=586396 RepID=A0AAV0HB99_9ROSI|nr:unnamed protein product [Linum tenue]CAI0446898.1 unnamed protein product [Linum tenue]
MRQERRPPVLPQLPAIDARNLHRRSQGRRLDRPRLGSSRGVEHRELRQGASGEGHGSQAEGGLQDVPEQLRRRRRRHRGGEGVDERRRLQRRQHSGVGGSGERRHVRRRGEGVGSVEEESALV